MAKLSHRALRARCAGLALVTALLPHWGKAESIAAYNTYNTPPFVTDSGGLAADLVDYLNSKLRGRFSFQAQTLPRNRLNQVVMAHPERFSGVVLFANKLFMRDPDGTRYLWSAPLLEDANLVVSHVERPVPYQAPSSLLGLRFGGVNGHIYAGIDELAAQHALSREDAYDEPLNLAKLAKRRIDVTVLPQSLYRFLQVHQPSSVRRLYVAARPHCVFERHILIAPSRPDLAQALQPVLAGMKSDPAWQRVLAKYNLGN